jgi:hypothetical protein
MQWNVNLNNQNKVQDPNIIWSPPQKMKIDEKLKCCWKRLRRRIKCWKHMQHMNICLHAHGQCSNETFMSWKVILGRRMKTKTIVKVWCCSIFKNFILKKMILN